MNKVFTVPAQMTRCSSLADGGLSIGYHTKEIADEEKVMAMKFHNKAGWLLFAENELDEKDIPAKDAEIEGKTPSQRLRGVIFIYWKQLGEQGDFEQFYRRIIEKFIVHIKNKLDQV